MRVDGILGQVNEFVSKVSGRIPVQKFIKETYDILRMIREFMMSRNFYSLREGNKRKVGNISLNVKDKTFNVDIIVLNDKYLNFKAGMDWTTKPPQLVFNLYTIQYYDPLFIEDKLKPLIEHELTHFLDNAYNPVYNVEFEPGELNSDFIKEYKELLHNYSPDVDYGDISSFKGRSIDEIARHNVLRFIKTKAFKDLIAKYHIKLDSSMLAKLLRIRYDLYLEDMNLFRDTGGFLLFPPKTKEEKEEYQRVKGVSTKLYFNSNAELKAYINQIISEIDYYLTRSDHRKTLIRMIRGEDAISNNIERLLNESKTFKENINEWTEASLQRIYKEVGTFLIKETKKISTQERAEVSGIKLNSEQSLMYRYLNKLLDTNPDKLQELIANPEFKKKNESALKLLLKDLELAQKIRKLTDSLPSLMKGK